MFRNDIKTKHLHSPMQAAKEVIFCNTKKEVTLDCCLKPATKGHFCSLLISNIIWLSSLSTVCRIQKLIFCKLYLNFLLKREKLCLV